MQDLGFWILNDIVWRKANPMPNFRGKRFTNAHETLIWASRSEQKGYTFHYEALKGGNDDLQMRSDWFIPLCTGDERLKGDDGRKLHPTQKPEALLARTILSSSNPGDVVLDPSSAPAPPGPSPSASAAISSGIEQEPAYAAAARERIAGVEPLSRAALLTAPTKRAEPRVPFLSLLEAGHVRAGETLTDERRRHKALVRPRRHAGRRTRFGLDPQDRRPGPGPAGLQRLDLLARRARRAPRLHRRFPRHDAGRHGLGRLSGGT